MWKRPSHTSAPQKNQPHNIYMGRIENLSSSVHKMKIETGYDFFTLKVSWYIRLHDLIFFFTDIK